VLLIDLENSWQPWSWKAVVSRMRGIHILIIVPGNVILWGSVLFEFLCICEKRLISQENIAWPFCVFIASFFICCGFGLICKPSYYMCDIMWCCLLDNVLMVWWNLCNTQYEITFEQTISLGICMQQHVEPSDKVKYIFAKQIYFCSFCILYVCSNVA